MFQPETEDMLPRMAPKPSSTVPTDSMARPQVPEVSILFGTQQLTPSQQMQQPPTQQTTSYAAWKKQILPKVTYPPGLSAQEQQSPHELIGIGNNNQAQDYNQARCGLYPLRNAMIPAVSMAMAGNGNSNAYMATNGNVGGYSSNNVNAMATPSYYRRSLESCNGNINYQPPPQAYRPTVETTPPAANSPRDVLTICAGTQTDATHSPAGTIDNGFLSGLASKQDIDEIKQIVFEIRQDQLRLMQILETFVFSQCANSITRAVHKDVAVQAADDDNAPDCLTNGNCHELGQKPLTAPTNKFIEHLKPAPNVAQTPKGKPIAQSTAYRPNTPSPNRLQERQQIESAPPTAQQIKEVPANYQHQAVALLNSASDKSLVMNELALKYLPNEKLTELLKELNINPPIIDVQKQICGPTSNAPSTPLRNVENFERNPTDISNASYKYLKKYHLLPEDQDELDENENKPIAPAPGQQYDPVRNSPVLQRQQPNVFAAKANSPFQQQLMGRLPPSPLVRASPPPQYRDNMLDLENIRQQPKFL